MTFYKVISSIILFSIATLCWSSSPSGLPPVLDFSRIEAPGHGRCQVDLMALKQGLNSSQPWALIMWDASVKAPVGILSETAVQFGDFDQCLTVTSPITSQYCLVDIQGNSTLWSSFKWGLCLPSSCSNQDLEITLQTYMDTENTGVKVKLSTNACVTKNSPSKTFTVGDITFSLVLMAVFGVVGVATIYDINVHPEYDGVSPPKTLAECLSVRHGWHSLFQADKPVTSVNLSVLYGLHAITSFCLVLGHRYVINVMFVLITNYRLMIENLFFSWHSIWTGHIDLLIDMFFFMSAFLLSVGFMAKLDKGYVNHLNFYLQRICRLVPAYAIVVFFSATLLRHMGDGPAWNLVMEDDSNHCSSQWWTNLLFINNYVGGDKKCLLHSWYLTCDFQLYVVGTILVFVLHRRIRFGTLVVAFVFGASTLTEFLGLYLYNRRPFLISTKGVVSNVRRDDMFMTTYSQTHFRGTCYLPGLIAGVYVYKNRNSAMSETSTKILQTLGVAIMLCVYGSGSLFYLEHLRPDQFWSSVYGATYHTAYGIGFSMVLTSFALGQPMLLARLFSWRGFVPLSRLSYCVYLVNFLIHFVWVGSLRSPVYVTFFNLVQWTIADVVISLVISLFMYLTVESPARQMAKLYLSGNSHCDQMDGSKKVH